MAATNMGETCQHSIMLKSSMCNLEVTDLSLYFKAEHHHENSVCRESCNILREPSVLLVDDGMSWAVQMTACG